MSASPRWRTYLDTNFFIRLAEGRDERLLRVLDLNVFVSSDKRLKMPETMKRIGLDEVAIEEVWP
ncbi:hypothetical protein [Afifella aestuarii]|uniref:hypothetical protein n=1 Tax=Afifella aestuarii TaxID=1909496 RepID=UPI000FE425AE|nr:hypothetical protein [Afifella aestuarii]